MIENQFPDEFEVPELQKYFGIMIINYKIDKNRLLRKSSKFEI